MDKLTRDAIKARKLGMTYGQYMNSLYTNKKEKATRRHIDGGYTDKDEGKGVSEENTDS